LTWHIRYVYGRCVVTVSGWMEGQTADINKMHACLRKMRARLSFLVGIILDWDILSYLSSMLSEQHSNTNSNQEKSETEEEAMLFKKKKENEDANKRRQLMKKNLQVAKSVWTAHFVLTAATMLFGNLYNGANAKYVPANLGEACKKGFVNVLAKARDEIGAAVCCDGASTSSLCVHAHPYLYKQLTRLPGALVLPLVPFVLRQVTVIIETMDSGLPTEKVHISLMRFSLYLAVFMFRAFVLFLGANMLEHALVDSAVEVCWYSDLHRGPSTCHGSRFDFSDHTVLYFGQILPITLLEFLHIFVTHHWNSTWKFTMSVLSCYLPYLYYITLYGEFNTAAYFHTGSEIAVGYAISLLIQVPLAYLQCSAKWDTLRQAVFGTYDNERND
jgi:hypothetical protein